jgi:hypothetical protein
MKGMEKKHQDEQILLKLNDLGLEFKDKDDLFISSEDGNYSPFRK